jgi:hypothetical protein
MRFNRPKVAREIDKDGSKMAVTPEEKRSENKASRAVTFAINGAYLDEDLRLEYTRIAKRVLG